MSSVNKSVGPSVYQAVHNPLRVPSALIGAGGSGPTYRAETLAYQTRVAAAGGSMNTAGLNLVDAMFANAEAQGITLLRGYLFGHAVNLPGSSRTVLELTGNGQSLTADAPSAGSVITTGAGTLNIEGTVSQQGKLFTASEALFDNQDWTQLCYVQKPLYNTNDPATASFYASQYSTFASGRIWISMQQAGATTIQPLGGGTAINYRSTNYGGGGIIEPTLFFLTYNSTTRQLQAYDPLLQQVIGTGAMPADFTILPTHFGAAQINSSAAGRPQQMAYCAHLKYAGVLTSAQMDSIWSAFVAHHRKICNYCLIYGNSVTSGADAAESTANTARNWPHLFSQLAARNNTLTIRPLSMGGKTLYFMRDTDFVRPTGSAYSGSYPVVTTSPVLAQDSVNFWGPRWRPNILVLDENQNTAANQSVAVTYDIDWAGTVGNPGIARHVIDKLRGFNSDLKVAAGTMLAVGTEGKSLATIIAEETSIPSRWRRNLRDWSASIRTDAANLYDAVYDLYADFNLGWDVADDGNALDPIGDYPRGNPALYFDDHQHPNAAGHAIMATGYWNAVNSIKPF